MSANERVKLNELYFDNPGHSVSVLPVETEASLSTSQSNSFAHQKSLTSEDGVSPLYSLSTGRLFRREAVTRKLQI